MKKVAMLFFSSVNGRVGKGNVFGELENMKENKRETRYVHIGSTLPPSHPHEFVKPIKLNYVIKRKETYKIHTCINIIFMYHSLHWISASPKGLAFPIVRHGKDKYSLGKQSQLFILC